MMSEKEFLTNYRQADKKTQKQVRGLLGIEPDPAENDIYFDLMLIGLQNIAPIIEHREQLQIIMNRRKFDNCIDAFILGIITGKRQERARRKKPAAVKK